MVKNIIRLIVFLSCICAFAQKEGANWYFGRYAGLDFNSGTPLAVTNGQLSQGEGCATISDSNGVLLFYTNGIEIYNANHQLMLNGSGLLGHDSTTQAALIIPDPGDGTKYYVFAADYEGGDNGLTYSVVDMVLDGGLGGVIPEEKNIQLVTPVSEKLTAVYHQNQHDIWVITHSLLGDQFLAYLITSSGISAQPVITNIGTNYFDNAGSVGCMKASPDGRLIATAKSALMKGVELFDFDATTGALSNARQITVENAYGVEFSSNSKVLYTSNVSIPFAFRQYDLSVPDLLSIQASAYLLSDQPYGTLQISIDGKIYAAVVGATAIAVINNPNEIGTACNFQVSAVDLASRICELGLPAFIQSYFIQEIRAERFCLGSPTKFSIRSGLDPLTANWDFGDSGTSTTLEPEHQYTTAGTYTVTVDFTTAAGNDVIHLEKEIVILPSPVANAPADLIACDALPNDGIATFTLTGQNAVILGSQSATAYTVTYHASQELAIAGEEALAANYTNTASPQTVYARVTNNITGCYDITTFDLIVNPTPVITDPDDLIACEAQQGQGTATFDLTQAIPQITGGNTDLTVDFYRISSNMPNNIPITAPQSYTTTTPGGETIYFRAYDAAAPNCTAGVTLGLVVNPLPSLGHNIADYLRCDENDPGDGKETFDLTIKYSEITSEPGLALTYSYEQAGTLVTISDPSAFTNTTPWQQLIYVSTQNAYSCGNVTSFTIKVSPLPAIEGHGPFYACEDEPGLGRFNLQDIAAVLTGGQPNLAAGYYATEGQAQDGQGPALASPYLSASTIIYARISNTVTNCVIVFPVSLEVIPGPTATNPAPLEVCDPNNDNSAAFNLDPVLAQIEAQLGGTVTAIPFETYDDAFYNAENNAIQDTSAYTNVEAYTSNGVQTLFIRVDSEQTDCFDIVELQLIVHPVPAVTGPEPYKMCDNGTNDTDGIAVFDLTTLEEGILNGQDPADYTVSFYNDVAGDIPAPASYPSASDIIHTRVTNNATGCFKDGDVELIVNPLPLANDPVPYTLCDSNNPGDEQEVFDLNTKIEEITGLQDGINVTFFHNYNDVLAGTGPSQILNPEAYTNTAAVETIFVRVTVEETGCYRIVLLDVRVEPVPVLVMPTQDELTVCDTTGLGIGVFDLNALIENMVNGATGLEVTFHTTYQDAIDGNNPITEDLANYHNVNPFAQFLYVRVLNTVTGCTRLEPYVLSLVVAPAPQAPEHLEDLVQCDDRDANGQDNKAYFDLTAQDALIHAALGTTPANLTIHYFTTEANANAGMPRITNPAHYLGTGGQTIWVRVETPGTGCFSLSTFDLILDKPLALTTPTVLALCNEALPNDGVTEFDLTVKDDEILGDLGIGQPGMTVAYFEIDPRVDITATPILNPGAYTNPPPPAGNPKTLYVVVTTAQGCKSYTTLTIKVLPLPQPDMDVDPLVLCDANSSPDGMELFNLTDAAADIRNNDATMVLTYYESFDDANNRENQISNITNYNSASRTIWVRAEANTGNAADPVCYQVVSFGLIVNMLPELGEAGVIEPYAICEQNTDGIANFDFNTHMDAILGEDADPADYTITFHKSEADRLAGIAMPYIYTNTSSPNIQNIIVQVINKDTGCTNWAPLALLVEEAATANPVTETFFECDYDGTNDGRFTFDLTRADDDALGTQNPADFSVTYYTKLEDAQAGENAIANPTAYQSAPDYQMLWVRVTNESTVSGCNDITTLELFVERLPEPVLIPDHTTVCIDFNTNEPVRDAVINSGLDATHTFVWFRDTVEIVGQTGPTLTATEPGSYNVIATSTTGCVSDPIAPVVIEKSGPASPIGPGFVVGNPFGENQVVTVLVEGYGDYQYSLDNGPWQNSNVFENVSPYPVSDQYSGHIVHVRDTATADPCDDLKLILGLKDVSIIDYPKFFTPNGDSYHDTWNIFGLDTDENRDAKIYIFDRYGKLLKQISAAGAGWDGTYNGNPMPGDDYWFTVAYTINGAAREFKAHFALKR